MDNSNPKVGLSTFLAVGGLVISLATNYIQYKKNRSDEELAKRQVEIAQEQATVARQELELKRSDVKWQHDSQLRLTQNCDQKKAERDDAASAVHKYDVAITRYEARLQTEKGLLSMAETNHDTFKIAEHRSLADQMEGAIKSLTASRDEAGARVSEIERQCGF